MNEEMGQKKELTLHAHAKINLCLDVGKRRTDGYHEVRMIMQSLSLCDDIRLEKTEDDRVRLSIQYAPAGILLPLDERNLMVRAALLMKEACGIREGLQMQLIKRIPAEAGLGGGSADAAAVLCGMNALFSAGLSADGLCSLGLRIGADVPFCIMQGTALAEGIGEILTPFAPAPLYRDMHVLLAKPVEGLSTAAMYAEIDRQHALLHPDPIACRTALESGDLTTLRQCAGNTFERPAIQKNPLIGTLRQVMLEEGALISHMSGSGPTVFGLFANKAVMQKTAARIRTAYADELSDVIETGVLSFTRGF